MSIVPTNADKEIIDLSRESNSILLDRDCTVTYKDLQDLSHELCRTVSNDKDLSRSIYQTIHEWKGHLRSGTKFDVIFQKNISTLQHSNQERDVMPKPATVTPNLSAKRQSRLKSSIELNRGNFTSTKSSMPVYDVDYQPPITNFTSREDTDNLTQGNDDEHFIGVKKKRAHACFLCGIAGHIRYNCHVLQKYKSVGGAIVRGTNRSDIDSLIEAINNTSGKNCYKRKEDDKRIVYSELPGKVRALVLIKKLLVSNDAVLLLDTSNTCIECTLLGEKGLEIPGYSTSLFSIGSVTNYVAKGGNRLIVNNIS